MTFDPDQPIRVLLADDQPDIAKALRLLLKPEGYEVVAVSSPDAAVDALKAGQFDAALIDMNYTRDTTSGREGLDLLSRLSGVDGCPPVIVMTAWGSIDLAVDAMRRGARDFIPKPWDNDRLLAVLRTQVELGRALRRSQRLEAENMALREQGARVPALVAESAAMRPVIQMIQRIGPSDAAVLVTGENGTGKSLVARALHSASARAGQPMITVNAGGLAEGVFESELFGHVKGAFTDAKADRIGRFELADRGTLFLDEIGNLSLAMQAKLLRVLETGEFERVGSSVTRRAQVRLISATNADLAAEMAAARFRRDLLFRLNTIEIRVPPLRDRREDIAALAAQFLFRHAHKYRKNLTTFDGAARRALAEHAWPGNVRELDHAVERAVLLAQYDPIRTEDLGLQRPARADADLTDLTLDEAERRLITAAMDRAGGNVVRAARSLGLSRSGLYRRLEKFGLAPPRSVESD